MKVKIVLRGEYAIRINFKISMEKDVIYYTVVYNKSKYSFDSKKTKRGIFSYLKENNLELYFCKNKLI